MYSGVPLFREYKIGEELDVMIDATNPPDVRLPDECHISFSSGGNCTLPGLPLFTLADALLLGVSAYWIIASCS